MKSLSLSHSLSHSLSLTLSLSLSQKQIFLLLTSMCVFSLENDMNLMWGRP